MADEYFYNSKGDAIPSSYVEGAIQDYKGNHDSSSIVPWDSGNRVTWQDALKKRTRDLIHSI